jgi:hypothetical protein
VEVKLFVKDDCPACAAASIACRDIANVSIYDLGDVDGLMAASAHRVRAVPSVLVVDSAGREVAAWRGEAPAAADLRAVLAN